MTFAGVEGKKNNPSIIQTMTAACVRTGSAAAWRRRGGCRDAFGNAANEVNSQRVGAEEPHPPGFVVWLPKRTNACTHLEKMVIAVRRRGCYDIGFQWENCGAVLLKQQGFLGRKSRLSAKVKLSCIAGTETAVSIISIKLLAREAKEKKN